MKEGKCTWKGVSPDREGLDKSAYEAWQKGHYDFNQKFVIPSLSYKKTWQKKKPTQNSMETREEHSWDGQEQAELFWTTYIIIFHRQD